MYTANHARTWPASSCEDGNIRKENQKHEETEIGWREGGTRAISLGGKATYMCVSGLGSEHDMFEADEVGPNSGASRSPASSWGSALVAWYTQLGANPENKGHCRTAVMTPELPTTIG